MEPKWGKGYGRKGAALTGQGMGGEAVKAYLLGLAKEPDNAGLRARPCISAFTSSVIRLSLLSLR